MDLHEQVMLFIIANSNSVGGFEKLAPEASLDDGLFDVFILKKCNLVEFIRVASAELRGEHINDPNMIYFKTKSIQVTSPDYVQINLDGEFGGTLPCMFSMLPSHINIIVDKSGNSTYKGKNGF
jgi:diacylglycerol kinase (ATP)